MTKLVAVVNPRAGSGRGVEIWERLLTAEPRLALARVVRAADADAAHKELEEAVDQSVERVLALGGDGTAHLVANHMLLRGIGDLVSLGLVPIGTGSDLARALGIPTNPHAALQRALSGMQKPLDVLRVESDDGRQEFVFNVASVGISGVVDQAVNALPRRTALSYLRATLGAIARYRPVPCRVEVDGEVWHEDALLLVAVANGPTFGKGMRVAPGARPDDGEADVVLVRPVPRWQLPLRLPQIYRGTHLRTRFVRVGRALSVRLEPAPTMPPFDLDGETFPAAPATISVVPGALKVVV